MPKKLTNEEFKERLRDYTKDTVELITPYVNKRTPVKVKCKECGYEWSIAASNLSPSNTKKYSFKGCPNCLYTDVVCDYCGKTFHRLKSHAHKDTYNYCSRECGNRHKNELRKLAGEWDNSKNYRLKAFEYLPHKCASCGWDEDERILEVHHIDENREHNYLENLCILCPTCHRKITLGFYLLTEDFKVVKKV